MQIDISQDDGGHQIRGDGAQLLTAASGDSPALHPSTPLHDSTRRGMTSAATIMVVTADPFTVYDLQEAGFRPQSVLIKDGPMNLPSVPTPSLIILDVCLSERTAFDICHTLKRDLGLASIPVLMLLHDPDDLCHMAENQPKPDDYLVEPFTLHDLVIRVRALLRSPA